MVARLSDEADKAVKDPVLRKVFLEQTVEPVGTTPAEFDAFLRAEQEKWGKVIKDAKLDLQPEDCGGAGHDKQSIDRRWSARIRRRLNDRVRTA